MEIFAKVRYGSPVGVAGHNIWAGVDKAEDWLKQYMAPFLGEMIVILARDDCSRVRHADPDGRFRELLRCADKLFGRVSAISARNYSFRRGFASAADARRGVEVYAERFREKGLPVWLPIACDGTDGIHACYQRNDAGVPGRFSHRAPLRQWHPPYWVLAAVEHRPCRDQGPRGASLGQEMPVLRFFQRRFTRALNEQLERAEAGARPHVIGPPGAEQAAPKRRRKLGPIQEWVRQFGSKATKAISGTQGGLEEQCAALDAARIPLPNRWRQDDGPRTWAGVYGDKLRRGNLSVLFSRLRKSASGAIAS